MSAQKRPAKKRRDLGRAVAVVFCVLFAVIGAVPLVLGGLVRTSIVREWVAQKTAALIARELGIAADYAVEVEAWPMRVALTDITVDASDGGTPFLRVERITARPRLFSLLAGELDVGEIEVDRPWIRAVVADGALTNLRYRLPDKPDSGTDSFPFSSLAVTEARLDLTVDSARVLAEELDADVSVEDEGGLEISVHVGGGTVTRVHPTPDWPGEDAVDEDRICRLEVRARIDDDEVLIRRLSMRGSADFDPDPGTVPSCKLVSGDWRSVDLALSALTISGIKSGEWSASGRVHAKVPLALAHRAVVAPHLTGSVTVDVNVDYKLGAPLPHVDGEISADTPGADGKVFSETLKAQVDIRETLVTLSKIDASWAQGKVAITEAKLDPFAKGVTLAAGPIRIEGIDFPDLIRDLGIHPQAVVGWTLKETYLPKFGGTLSPLDLKGQMSIDTEDFQVFDRSARRPERKRMIGLPEARLKGTFAVRPEGVAFQGFAIDSPHLPGTHLMANVQIGFKETITLDIGEGSIVDLAEISPLGDIPIAGILKIKAAMRGHLSHPKMAGDVSVSDFVFGGLPVGQVESSKFEFEPLKLTLTDARIRKGSSYVRVPRARFAFDLGPVVVADADVDTREAPYLGLHDMLDTFQMDKIVHDNALVPDPRWADIRGRAAGTAKVHFVVGGPEDRCGGGLLKVDGDLRLLKMDIYGEHYSEGDLDFSLVWDDKKAGANGMKLDVRSAILRKGEGTITATGMIRHGGVLRAQAIASGVPIGSLDVLGKWGARFDGTINAVARIGGRLDRMNGMVDVDVSRVRVGPASFGASRLTVEIAPKTPAGSTPKSSEDEQIELQRAIEKRCGGTAGAPYEYASFLRDASQGDFIVNGQLFGGQITLRDVSITQQRRKIVTGSATASDLDLGVLANLVPGVAFSGEPVFGKLSAALDMKRVPLGDLPRTEASLVVSKLTLDRGGRTVRLLSQKEPIRIENDTLLVPGLRIEGRTASGLSAIATADGRVEHALSRPSLDFALRVEPLGLQKISSDIPGVERANGIVDANLRVQGPPDALRYTGAAHLKNGELYLKGLPVGLTDAQVDIEVGAGDIRIKRAVAKMGAGTVNVTGGVQIHGTSLGTATAKISARNIKLPVADGVVLTADADLNATLPPPAEGDDEGQRLPDVKGQVSLTSFSYTRPIELAVNVAQLGSRQRTNVETYDPKNDVVRFDLNIVSPKPLSFSNNLVDMQLEVVEPGLVLSGTNQKYGAKGLLRIRPESKLRLRDTEFEVREGTVRFDDAQRIAPRVDVRATSEYRRSSSSFNGGSAPDASVSAGAATTQAGGVWRITMHAYGNAEALKVDLTSDPALRQEDIVLLLTLGVTRAELDQGLASSVGETVGLEALSALTGADKAVKTIVPVIDEFRFGTSYSSRTNRPQPTLTVGKRLSNSVRATVTTGVNENRDVRGTIEWQLDKGVRIQGSYDNFNDTYGLPFGNIGADLRWRIEFE